MTKILIIDDEPDIVESLEVMLTPRGYHVVTASSGGSGVGSAASEKPDIILLDVMMPGMDGFETCRRLKNSDETKNIPVLLLTALNQSDDKVKGLDAGADDFITKPFNDVELRARVRAFVRTKKLRDDLEESYRRLKELEQLRDSLTHMLVHDLKVPLTAVKGGVETVLDAMNKKENLLEPHRRLLANAKSGADKVLGLIQDILDASRMEENKLPLHKSPVDMAALARSCAAMVEPLRAQSQVALTINAGPSLPEINLDEALVGRVLVNLISNSLKFTPPGGTITVSLSYRPGEKQVECAVHDTGSGIPQEDLEKIFDKFFQRSDFQATRKGQGLGLAFCRLAVERHGGKIWAESENGKGSRFVMRFPLS